MANANVDAATEVMASRSSPQSSPNSSSNVSESDVDVSSLSRHSSCSSLLNQQNASLLATITTSSASPLLHAMGQRVARRTELDGAARTRPACSVSDDDVIAEDSSSSSSTSSMQRRTTVGQRWRSPSDTVTCGTDPERKLSLPRTLTPSPSVSGRSSPAFHPLPPHSRVANIRRESNCSMESEAAHERLIQIAQQVSLGFDEFSIGDSGERKRTHSLSEPISVLTNAFIPQSCSPSPTRSVDVQKQCYSPSAQQVVRNNITYSPSPSPTPSPTRRVMRYSSLSPIVGRPLTKRRYTNSFGGEFDFDSRSTGVSLAKRVCQQPYVGSRVCVSPLVLENPTNTSDSSTKSPELTSSFSSSFSQRLLVDPAITAKMPTPPMELDEDGSSIGVQKTISSASGESSEMGDASLKTDA